MVAAVIILLVVWITVMIYNSFVAKPQKDAQAQNAFNAIYTTINELLAGKEPFAATTVDIQLPDGYVIAFFDRNNIIDTCSDELWYAGEDEGEIESRIYKSLVKAHCTPPCMCYYNQGNSRAINFFKDNNNPDHKECRQLPSGISNIVTWFDKELTGFYIKNSKEEVFASNIKGDRIEMQNYPKIHGISYSNAFIYGKCDDIAKYEKRGDIEFGLKQLYIEKTELTNKNQKRSIIFITGKAPLTDLRKETMPSLLKLELLKNE